LEERLKQLDEEIPRLQAEVDLLKISYHSKDQVVTNARDLYSRWPTLEYQEKRKVTESLTERITIGHGEISIDLCYLPSSPSPEMMAKGQQIATNEHEWTGFVETLIHSRAADHE